jgi:large subunit ribosomal protein L20
MSYSELINKIQEKNVLLNRKVLADIAMNHPDVFKAIIEKIK